MRGMKIGARMGLSFGLLLLLLIGIGVLSLAQMRRMEQSTETIAHVQFSRVRLAESGLQRVNSNARMALDLFLQQDPREREKVVAAQREQSQEITRIYDRIEKTLSSDEEKSLFREVLAAREYYVEQRAKAERTLQDGNRDLALMAMEEKVLPALSAYTKAWDVLLAFEGDQVDAAGTEAADEYSNARIAIFAGVGVALLFGFVTALVVAPGITKPILQVVQTTHRIAEGDLTDTVEAVGNDETASLLRAVGTMLDYLSK